MTLEQRRWFDDCIRAGINPDSIVVAIESLEQATIRETREECAKIVEENVFPYYVADAVVKKIRALNEEPTGL